MTPPRAVLVTGSHRSGTTWVGAGLASGGQLQTVHEPFHPDIHTSWLRTPPSRWFEHLPRGYDGPIADDVRRIVELRPPLRHLLRRSVGARQHASATREWLRSVDGRARRRGVLIKDPIAFFSTPWLAEDMGFVPVVLVRHPAAFASSLKRLGWTFDFSNLTSQPRLMAKVIPAEHRQDVERAEQSGLDVIDQSVLLWNLITSVTLRYAADHPEWLVLRYEDLAMRPLEGFEDLYQRLGLDFNERARASITRLSGRSNGAEVADGDRGGVARDSQAAMWTWLGRLDSAEVEKVRRGTAQAASAFYDDNDWAPASTAPDRRTS